MAHDARVSSVSLSRRSWYRASLIAGVPAVALCFWGFLTQDPAQSKPIDVVVYVGVPVAIYIAGALSLGRRTAALLVLVALLDVESALLGFAPLIALPFVVSVPLVGLAVSARLTSPDRLWLRYLVAWAAGSLGVAIAVLRTVTDPFESTMMVIPTFAAGDALGLLLLYRLYLGSLRASHAIDRAESQARDLLNGIDLIGVNVNRDSCIDFINDYALRVTGWTREEVLGKDWYETFATPDRRAAARENYTHVVAGERTMDRQRESEILTRSGSTRLIRWSHVHRHGPDGTLVGVASLGEDVTAQHAAEEEKRRYEELVSNLVHNSPLAAAVLGLDRIVQLWNPAATDLLGWTEDELVGKPVPPVFLGRDRWVTARMFAQAARGEAPEHHIVQLATRDEKLVLVRFFVGTVRDGDGRPIAVSVQAEDVTAIHEMEERLREAQHMESIGRLAGGVAHDFNNSLTAIGGFASLIAATTREDDSRNSAETIMTASRRAAELTRELLAYSRRSVLKPQVIDVNELLISVRPVLVSLLEPRVSLVVDTQVTGAFVRVDPGAFERAIVNLVTNARDAMPDGGVVSISTERSDAMVAVSVSDRGTGIPIEAQSKVFEPFFTTKAVGSGTGLGLAMVKGFVIQSGGLVELVSEPGEGTTITIRLPAASAPEVKPVLEVAQPPRGGSETILVVEDDPAVAEVAFRILSRSGYHVLLADCGAAALSLLGTRTTAIDLLLLDVMLPDTRGPKLAEEARPLAPDAALLFASGYSAEELVRSGELSDGIELIEKPYEPAEILAHVRRLLDGAKVE